MWLSRKSPGFMSRRQQDVVLMSNILKVVKSERVNEDTIRALNSLLEMALAGEIAWAARDCKGGKLYGYAGQAYDDPLGVAGVVGKLQLALTCHGYNPCNENSEI